MFFAIRSAVAAASLAAAMAWAGSRAGENIIVLIPDGCGTSHQTVARWFKGAPLAYDKLTPGLCRTFSANSMITGSAAASTAFATGYKTWEQDGGVKCLGLLPDSVVVPAPRRLAPAMRWRPVASVLEAARLRGMATGLVATSRISHATPAGYSSHWHDRDNDNVIAEQQVYQNIDVVFGGGMQHLLPASAPGGRRTDGENLVEVLASRGYRVISTRGELTALPPSVNKVWGLFSMSHMASDIDRRYFGKEEPSLAEMTGKAISILSRNRNGFFLMVEGSQVDWASHNNDAVGTVSEFMAFDAAVKTALDFATANNRTTVLVFPDHDNGGMSLGRRGDSYTDIQIEKVVPVLKNARITASGLLDTLIRSGKRRPVDFAFAAAALKDFMGIGGLAAQDSIEVRDLLKSVARDSMQNSDVAAIGRIIDRRSHIAWTTYGHTGSDVWIYGLGVNFKGTLDNTDIASICFGKMGVDRDTLNRTLFQDANDLFRRLGGRAVTIDTAGAAGGKGTVTISTIGKTAVFPFFKNEMRLRDGRVIQMEGLTVFSEKSGKVFLPAQALKLFGNN